MTNQKDLQKLVIDEFSHPKTLERYIKNAKDGLWKSEEILIDKYFTKGSSVLDIGCGTGRTTAPLFKKGYKVVGIDFTPKMIEVAKAISKKENLEIEYRIGDATDLKFKVASFDNALFSFNGWTQIPGNKNRENALKEIYRVLKPSGYYIFTANIRYYLGKYLLLWTKEAIKHSFNYLGSKKSPLEYGDIFFTRDSTTHYQEKQYTHIPSSKEVKEAVAKTEFELIFYAYRNTLAPEDKKLKSHNCMFFVCQKK